MQNVRMHLPAPRLRKFPFSTGKLISVWFQPMFILSGSEANALGKTWLSECLGASYIQIHSIRISSLRHDGFWRARRLIGFYTHAQKDLISSAEFMAGEKRATFCHRRAERGWNWGGYAKKTDRQWGGQDSVSQVSGESSPFLLLPQAKVLLSIPNF